MGGVIRRAFPEKLPSRVGIAVSGGGDSVALLHVLAGLTRDAGTELHAATVDHGLRPEAAGEAAFVAKLSRDLGVAHDILRWQGWDGAGNLQAEARAARYRLLTDWARGKGIAVLALGHTADDQAETVLMRLARAGGVNGLSGIPARRMQDGITLLRPCLGLMRAELRDYLRAQGVAWIEDPSNEDARFERVRARATLAALHPLGIEAATLAEVARNMSEAREALDWYTFLAARDMVQIDGGDVLIDRRQFRTLPGEIARRLLGHALLWIGGGVFSPRGPAMRDALEAARTARVTTLNGCVLLHHAGLIWITREVSAVIGLAAPASGAWDDRWQALGDVAGDLEIRALGEEGLRQYRTWRDTGRPRRALLGAPALWRGADVVSAPLAGLTGPGDLELVEGAESFFASILSH
ncbi:MAG: tRNA lysidine(34) synthetase TilS [Rhodobacteraceae bacterium]|nr:MAG: tRNA lysidine(34) synthetase TilS [Paracoccaceae bacterium]